jgi:hypothetical protein
MIKRIRALLASPIILLALVACSSGTTTPPAADNSATPVPPPPSATVAVQSNASATPAPAATEAVAVAPPPASLNSPLGIALQKFGDANTYRVEMEMKGQGALGLSGDDTKPDPLTSLFSLKGDFKNGDGHYTLKGFLTSLLGVEPDKGFEAMLVGDKGYVRGPVSLLGATDAKWYVLEADQSEAVAPPIDATDLISGLNNSGVDLSKFKKSGMETLDKQKCDVYSSDPAEALKAMNALNPGSLPGVDELSSIKSADVKLSLCADGYVHHMIMNLHTVAKDTPDKSSDFSVDMHVYDFNANITVTAPANATPLKVPDLPGDATATPSQ